MKIVWFVGSFGRSIDLAPVIEAAEQLAQRGLARLQFVFSGAGDQEQHWRRAASQRRDIIFTGWVDRAKIVALGSIACVGLQPYRSGASQGLANKLYEYLSFGLPTVSSLRGENADFLEKNGCGASYIAGNSHSLAAVLESIVVQPGRLDELRAKANRAFQDHCEAEAIYQQYAMHVERVAQKQFRLGLASTATRHEGVVK